MNGWRMNCDVGEATEGLKNELWRSKATEGLENELWRRWSDGTVGEWALLCISISMSSAHSPNFLSLQLRHNSFSNPSVALLRHSSFSSPSIASPTSQFFLQPFFRFTYVTSSSLNSPGEPPTREITGNAGISRKFNIKQKECKLIKRWEFGLFFLFIVI